mgnify:FL=1
MAKKKQREDAAEEKPSAGKSGTTGGGANKPAARKSTAKKPGASGGAAQKGGSGGTRSGGRGSGGKREAATEAATKAVATREPASEPEVREGLPEETPHRRELLDQIVSIAKGLEDDGLELLLEQAKVVEYKGKIEKFNRRLNVAAREAIAARQEAGRPDYHVTIERTEDDFFIIQLDDQRVFFNRNELRELTRICHKAKDRNAAARNLFKWFERERSDLLADTGINSNRSPYLHNLYEVIVSTYKVRE